MQSLSRRFDPPDLAGPLQGVALGLLVAYAAGLLRVLLPLALLQPAWQLRAAEASRAAAHIPLFAVILLLLAQRYDPRDVGLARRVVWVRRLAAAAALGYLLLLPLQVSAALRQIDQTVSLESRQLQRIESVVTAIERADSPQAMNRAIAGLPGLPANFQGQFARPIPEVRTALLAQIRPQIQPLQARLSQLRTQRLQDLLPSVIFDSFIALGLFIAFAAVGCSGEGQPTLLQRCLSPFGRLRVGGVSRSRGPVSKAWLHSLQENDPAAPAPSDRP